MSRQPAVLDGIKEAFEDFLVHDAEFAIAEATRDHDHHKRLWLVLYGDGRYALVHASAQAGLRLPEERGMSQLAFPIEPLEPGERDWDDLENSRFEGPIERLWANYDLAGQARRQR